MKIIPYGRQNITDEDIQAVVETLKSDFLTQGPAIGKFEQAFAKYCGSKYAIALSSATAGLHLSCAALDLKSGDILWTSPNTFVASANCGRYLGATVDFVDIDPKTYNMSTVALKTKLEKAAKIDRLPKVLIPVHHSGLSCDMKEIHQLSKTYGFKVIEDASHSVGGSYLDSNIGSCTFSDMAVFSFHPVKIMTTGEGGIVTTNSKDFYDKIMRLRTHGVTREADLMTHRPDGPWYYQQIDLGWNYRMTDIQAALGYSQLQRVNTFVKRRHQLAKRYDDALKDLPLTLPIKEKDRSSALHLYVVKVDFKDIRKSQKQIFEELHALGIMVNLHYIPVHLQPYYRTLGFKEEMFPEAEKYYHEAMSLPLFYDLTDEDQDHVIACIKKALR